LIGKAWCREVIIRSAVAAAGKLKAAVSPRLPGAWRLPRCPGVLSDTT
jgi:hypothetical protein